MDGTTRQNQRARPRRGSRLDRWLRARVLARLDGMQGGRLRVDDPDGVHGVGVSGPLDCRVEVSDLRFWRMLATGGGLGAGEAYVAGLWETDDLVGVIRLLARNRNLLVALDGGPARLSGWLLRFWHRLNRNSLDGSRANISAHYDLGNPFFAQWLDSRMIYSSAVYSSPDESLDHAQARKLRLVCNKLELGPDDHLLEVGTGWGGLAVFAAAEYGCRVTTTTISRAQYDWACASVREAGLEDRITVLLKDYRELEGRFDKLVSIEMIEAVGHQYLDSWFTRLADLLRPDGLALIQAITIEDYRYRRALGTVDFIKRYIFPGSFIPSVSAIAASMARRTDFGLVDLEDIGASYALTLNAWRRRFEDAWPRIREMGYDEAFRRRWNFYLAYCEGGFRERAISDVQLLLARPERGEVGRAAPS